MALAGDLDGDRDMDLVILREGQPAKVFLNDLLGSYHEADLGGVNIRGDLGGVLQDFNGDGQLDVLVLGGNPARLQLFLGDGHGPFPARGRLPKSPTRLLPGARSVVSGLPTSIWMATSTSWSSPRTFTCCSTTARPFRVAAAVLEEPGHKRAAGAEVARL